MRIVHVVPSYLPATRYGGPIYSVHGLCKALAAAGHEIHVFTTSVDGPADSDVPYDRPVLLDGVYVHYFRSRRLRRLYWAPELRRSLAAELPSFDVMHLHSVYLWPTNAAARLATRMGVPYVLAPRGMLVRRLIEEKNRLIKTAWLHLIESSTLRNAGRLHFTSRIEEREARELFPRLPPACIVPNGVDAMLACSSEPASAPVREAIGRGPFCLFLGRLHPVKGLDLLLGALAGTDVRLLLCGNDEDDFWPTLSAAIQRLGLRRQVERLGPVYGPDKQALLASARVLVLPSISENFGNVVLEAMAAGCPVVTTEGVGAGEFVREGRAGIVCEFEVAALREALLQLWGDAGLRATMGSNAVRYVGSELTWTQVASRMAGCYEHVTSIVERPRSRR